MNEWIDREDKRMMLYEKDVTSRIKYNKTMKTYQKEALARDARSEERNKRIMEINEENLKLNVLQTTAWQHIAVAMEEIARRA